MTVLRVLLVLLVVLLAVGLYRMEWVEVETDEGYGVDALRNPYLAATRFAEQGGTTVTRVNGLSLLDDLPATDDVILFASSRRALSERRADALLDWVGNGGHLILLATSVRDDETGESDDRVLDSLGIALLSADEDDDGPPEEVLGSDIAEMAMGIVGGGELLCGSGGSLVEIEFEGSDDGVLRAAFSPTRHLLYEGDAGIGFSANEVGDQLVQVSHGGGWVTVVTSMRLWRNRVIGCNDHAHLLRMLIGEGGAMWWLFNTEMPPLWVILWDEFPTVILALALMLVLWLWNQAFRMAPALPLPTAERRSVMEHVVGVARFFWQQNRGDALLAPMRSEILRAMPPEEAAWLSEIARQTPFDAQQIRWALREPVGKHPDRFVEAVRILQSVRSIL